MPEIDNDKNFLLNSVRSVGIIKPVFNPVQKGFDAPRLEIGGTGFWLASGIFITCAHVVTNVLNQSVELVGMLVVGGNERIYRKATISAIDYLHDLAFLSVEPNNEQDAEFLNSEMANGLEIYDGELNVGDAISYAGFPLGNQLLNEKHSPTYAEGVIGSKVIDEKNGPKVIQISGPVVGGYSGSPIVLKNDFRKVISIVSHSPSIEAGQANIFRSIHWKHIKSIENLSIS